MPPTRESRAAVDDGLSYQNSSRCFSPPAAPLFSPNSLRRRTEIFLDFAETKRSAESEAAREASAGQCLVFLRRARSFFSLLALNVVATARRAGRRRSLFFFPFFFFRHPPCNLDHFPPPLPPFLEFFVPVPVSPSHTLPPLPLHQNRHQNNNENPTKNKKKNRSASPRCSSRA